MPTLLVIISGLVMLMTVGCDDPVPGKCKWVAKDIRDYENAGMPSSGWKDYVNNLARWNELRCAGESADSAPTPEYSLPTTFQGAAQPYITITLHDDEPGRCRLEKTFRDGTGRYYTFPQVDLAESGPGMSDGVYTTEMWKLQDFAKYNYGQVVEEPASDTADSRCLTPAQEHSVKAGGNMAKVDAQTLALIRELFERYEDQLRSPQCLYKQKGSRVRGAGRFVNWLADDWSPFDYKGNRRTNA